MVAQKASRMGLKRYFKYYSRYDIEDMKFDKLLHVRFINLDNSSAVGSCCLHNKSGHSFLTSDRGYPPNGASKKKQALERRIRRERMIDEESY